MHAAMTTLDSRFMMGYPLIQALFLIPGHDYANRGYYQFPLPWALEAERVLAAESRKLLNIAGIDVITIDKRDLPRIRDRSDLQEIETPLHPRLDPGYLVFRDKRSYGLAYIARSITEIDTDAVEKAEQTIQRYFHSELPMKEYLETINKLRSKLLRLPGPHDVIIERENAMPDTILARTNTPGSVKFEGMIGPRAAMTVNC